MLQVNGKLVYFLLTLLVAITGYTSADIIGTQKELSRDIQIVKNNVLCLTSDLDSYKSLHGYQHKVLDEKMSTLCIPGRPAIPAN